MKGRARVLDSTPIYRRRRHRGHRHPAAGRDPQAARRPRPGGKSARRRGAGVAVRDDEYATPGKPPCDWDDRAAREALVDALVRDAHAALECLDDNELPGAAIAAAELLALVAGQDVEEDDDGVFRIVRKVAKDRVISTVDTEARHGHKSRNRHFDGYKAHLSIDPDSELIDEVVATPANTPDRDAVAELLGAHANEEDKPEVLGDSAYADGATREGPRGAGFSSWPSARRCATRPGGSPRTASWSTSRRNTVTCPAGQRVAITRPVTAAAARSFRSTARAARCAGLHEVTRRSHGRRSTTRGDPPTGPGRAGRPGVGSRLSGEPTPRRAQDRPLRPTGLGRATRHGPEGWTASPPISTRERAPSTGHGLRSSDCSGTTEDGTSQVPEGPSRPTWSHHRAEPDPHAPPGAREIPTPLVDPTGRQAFTAPGSRRALPVMGIPHIAPTSAVS